VVASLIKGHKNFHADYLSDEREYLGKLAREGQNPTALYVGCSDSRVVPEILMNADPGHLFVVRNVANLIPPLEHADASVGAAIDYAVGELKVPDIIVCGHYGCGGVKAVLHGLDGVKKYASLHEWLSTIEPSISRFRNEPGTDEDRWKKAVEENVIDQLDNLISFPVVRQALEAGKVKLHGWLYDLYRPNIFMYDVQCDMFVPMVEIERQTIAPPGL